MISMVSSFKLMMGLGSGEEWEEVSQILSVGLDEESKSRPPLLSRKRRKSAPIPLEFSGIEKSEQIGSGSVTIGMPYKRSFVEFSMSEEYPELSKSIFDLLHESPSPIEGEEGKRPSVLE